MWSWAVTSSRDLGRLESVLVEGSTGDCMWWVKGRTISQPMVAVCCFLAVQGLWKSLLQRQLLFDEL